MLQPWNNHVVLFIITCICLHSSYGEKTKNSAADQLQEYKESNNYSSRLTTGYGVPVDSLTNTLTAGPRGPTLLQDSTFLDHISHFDRERIPERVVHAKGAGAFGYFEVTHDITQYTKACVFRQIGKRTNIAVRFSQVAGERGSQDTVRDPRGFALKFYTEDGIWDLVGNNTPIFFIRDAFLFPSFIHSQKRNPVTNLKDSNMFWDFLSLRKESTFQVLRLFSDLGIPDGYTHMDGFGSNTFKLQSANGTSVYCKFHYLTNQGIKNLPVNKAEKLASSNPDYLTEQLYNEIHERNFPSWRFCIQVMTFEQAERLAFNPFDVTKIWPESDYPLIDVGTIILNQNPKNYFTDVEQIGFNPANMIPGIEPSPDKMLQGRLFSYGDTQRYRLGPNYLQLAINCPYSHKVRNYQRDGPQAFSNQDGAPNYYPNSFSGPTVDSSTKIATFPVSKDVARYDTSEDDNFSQPSAFYQSLPEDEKNRLINNLCSSIEKAKKFIQKRAVENFYQVNQVLGKKLNDCLEAGGVKRQNLRAKREANARKRNNETRDQISKIFNLKKKS